MQIDISNCEKEPIHVPGSIQSFGALIGFNTNFEVLFKSENFSEYFECDPGSSLSQLSPDLMEKVSARIQGPALLKERFTVKGK
ncbi:MAG: hypothetical protein H0V66_06665 [Bdellovibrionales bacterium]|nr:hypothetical protein [Bdellovibrionales bacterium]